MFQVSVALGMFIFSVYIIAQIKILEAKLIVVFELHNALRTEVAKNHRYTQEILLDEIEKEREIIRKENGDKLNG